MSVGISPKQWMAVAASDRTAETDQLSPEREAWLATARQSQLPPEGDWRTWLLLTGRGFGKTRAAAEDCAWYALTHPGHRIGGVAPTSADGRDICVEGESGLLAAIPHANIENWNRSI